MLRTSVIAKGIEHPEQFKRELDRIKRAGFDAIDLNLYSEGTREIMRGPNAEKESLRIRGAIENAGLTAYQCHPAFNPYNYGDPEKGRRVIESVWQSFPFAAAIGIPYAVVHPMRPRDARDPFFSDPGELIRRNLEMYSAMVPKAAEAGLTLCVENLFSVLPDGRSVHGYTSRAEELNALMDAVPGLCVCLDTGHAFITGQDCGTLVRDFGKRLKLLHIHGNDGVLDLHVSPFEFSDKRWDGFCSALRETGYDGTLNFETDCFLGAVPEEIRQDAYNWIHACAGYLAAKVG